MPTEWIVLLDSLVGFDEGETRIATTETDKKFKNLNHAHDFGKYMVDNDNNVVGYFVKGVEDAESDTYRVGSREPIQLSFS